MAGRPRRKPKGTQVRTVADWFYDTSVTTGANPSKLEGDTASWCEVALYNDGQQGWLIYLDMIIVNAAGDDWFAAHYQGVDGGPSTPGGTIQQGVPVYSGQGKQPGAIYTFTGASAPLGATGVQRSVGRIAGAIQQATMFNPNPDVTPAIVIKSRGPLAVIKPGYSYGVVFIPFSGFVPSVTFAWTAING